MKRILFLLIVFTCNLIAQAQQDPQYSQYMFNSLVINPAYAGYKENVNVSLLHRDQWSGMKGAPKTQSIVADGAFGYDNNVGLGIALVNDKIGLQRETSAHLNYSYRLRLRDDESRLAFGLAVGLTQYALNNDDAQLATINDPNFMGNQSFFTPDAKVGIYYSNAKFYSGLSATNLLSTALDSKNSLQKTIGKKAESFYFSAGYLADLSENIKFKPSILIKESAKNPTNVDINSFFLIDEAVWLGASYRAGVNLWKKNNLNSGTFKANSVVGVVEVFIAQNLRLGYAYDYSVSSLSNYSNGSHEISLGLIINANKRSTSMVSPRYF